MGNFFSSKEQKQILHKEEERIKAEKKKQEAINKEKAKVAAEREYKEKKGEYDDRVREYGANCDGFCRYGQYLAKQAVSLNKKIYFDVKKEIKGFRLEKIKEYLDDVLPKKEAPPIKPV